MTAIDLPLFGLGTYRLRGDPAVNVVRQALTDGIRLVDTAQVYRNEAEVGQGAALSGVARENLFITTKLSPRTMGFDAAFRESNTSLTALGMDYVDCYLIHWPGAKGLKHESEENARIRRESWVAMEELYRKEKCKRIGVSNYTVRHLEELLDACDVHPAVNQVEFHPMLQQRDLRRFCEERRVRVQGYSILGEGKLVTDPIVTAVAERHGVPPAVALLCWARQTGIPVLAKSASAERNASNFRGMFAHTLDADGMAALDALDRGHHFCWDSQGVR